MENIKNTGGFYIRIGRYSFWIALCGLICCLFLFPSGIYYGFFCGVMSVAAAVMSKRASPSGITTAAIVLGIIDIGMSALAFYGIYGLYAAIADPELGPVVTGVISDMLSQYGISLETFSYLLAQ